MSIAQLVFLGLLILAAVVIVLVDVYVIQPTLTQFGDRDD